MCQKVLMTWLVDFYWKMCDFVKIPGLENYSFSPSTKRVRNDLRGTVLKGSSSSARRYFMRAAGEARAYSVDAIEYAVQEGVSLLESTQRGLVYARGDDGKIHVKDWSDFMREKKKTYKKPIDKVHALNEYRRNIKYLEHICKYLETSDKSYLDFIVSDLFTYKNTVAWVVARKIYIPRGKWDEVFTDAVVSTYRDILESRRFFTDPITFLARKCIADLYAIKKESARSIALDNLHI